MNLDGDIEGSNDKIFFKDVSFEFRSVRWDTFILCRQGKKKGGEFLGGGELIGRIRYPKNELKITFDAVPSLSQFAKVRLIKRSFMKKGWILALFELCAFR